MQLSQQDDLENYDPMVSDELTLNDMLVCTHRLSGESLRLAKSFHKKFMSSEHGKAKHEIYVLQAKLWDVERKLNTHRDDRIYLAQGWLNGPSYELAHLFVRMTTRYEALKGDLERMEADHGKAEDICKEILKLHAELPSYRLPRWLDRFNPAQLNSTLDSLKYAIETAREREAETLHKQREAKTRAAHEQELKRIDAERSALRDARKSELGGIVRNYTEMVTKILAHPVFRGASITLPKISVDTRTEFTLGTLGEEGYQLLVRKAREEIAAAKRKLREPLRRAHQSAHSRGITKLSFEECLKQEGFADLLS